MEIGRISIRYARALFEYAGEQAAADVVYGECGTMAAALMQTPEIKPVLQNPMVSAEDKIKLLEIAAGGNVSAVMKRFIRFVVGKHKEAYMLFIAMSYRNLYCKEHKIVFAHLTSATELPEALREQILGVVHRVYTDAQVEVDYATNPDLLGGFVLDIDDTRLDASLAGELASIRKAFGLAPAPVQPQNA